MKWENANEIDKFGKCTLMESWFALVLGMDERKGCTKRVGFEQKLELKNKHDNPLYLPPSLLQYICHWLPF